MPGAVMLLDHEAGPEVAWDGEPVAKLSRKHAGAYYTPEAVASTLVRWAVRGPTDRLLDPSCGDGRLKPPWMRY